jgi:hypothetical protein
MNMGWTLLVTEKENDTTSDCSICTTRATTVSKNTTFCLLNNKITESRSSDTRAEDQFESCTV